ncbi:DUF1120 domain-containing protein [Stenotrophomonas geniculata]|uniref:DUF1120 domain-containing protein n=1 Tax=Stenotrophomonas geniculata TaxID=86188 RepID=UPI003AAD03B5
MNIKIAISCALAPIFLPFAASAGPLSVDVQGVIKAAACTIEVSAQGSFDYGKVKQTSLKIDSHTLLPPIERELRISCGIPTRVALTSSDLNKGLTAFSGDIKFSDVDWALPWTPARQYGLRSAAGRAIGAWALVLGPGFKVDGKDAASVYSSDNGQTWRPSSGNFFHDDGGMESWSAPGNAAPLYGSEFVGKLSVRAALDRVSTLGQSDDIPFHGGAVLTLTYL